MLVDCNCCGKEIESRWAFEIFIGGTRPIYLCGECYRKGSDKVDSVHAIRSEKAKRKRLY